MQSEEQVSSLLCYLTNSRTCANAEQETAEIATRMGVAGRKNCDTTLRRLTARGGGVMACHPQLARSVSEGR
jgi:hypothetical protein